MNEHNLDFDRQVRVGFPEVVYGENKTTQQLISITGTFVQKQENLFVTRLQEEKAKAVLEHYPQGEFHFPSKTLRLCFRKLECEGGNAAILVAGTSDSRVAWEAQKTLEFLGVRSQCYWDIGVAGLHRLQAITVHLKHVEVLLCVAGFEGALPSVVGGMLPQPIIAVPTSTGYGVTEGGKTALHAMLSSCAAGVSVVNIDNGFGAAVAAYRILNRKQNERTKN